jgi:hypothetical protein
MKKLIIVAAIIALPLMHCGNSNTMPFELGNGIVPIEKTDLKNVPLKTHTDLASYGIPPYTGKAGFEGTDLAFDGTNILLLNNQRIYTIKTDGSDASNGCMLFQYLVDDKLFGPLSGIAYRSNNLYSQAGDAFYSDVWKYYLWWQPAGSSNDYIIFMANGILKSGGYAFPIRHIDIDASGNYWVTFYDNKKVTTPITRPDGGTVPREEYIRRYLPNGTQDVTYRAPNTGCFGIACAGNFLYIALWNDFQPYDAGEGIDIFKIDPNGFVYIARYSMTNFVTVDGMVHDGTYLWVYAVDYGGGNRIHKLQLND